MEVRLELLVAGTSPVRQLRKENQQFKPFLWAIENEDSEQQAQSKRKR